MDSLQFCYWLNGFFELNEGPYDLSSDQVNTIKEHLALVFNKVTGPKGLKRVYNSDIEPFSQKLCDNSLLIYNPDCASC